MSPLPGELRRQYASCDYDVRHNVSAFGLYQVPFHSSHALLRQIFGGWSFSETAILHSGLPFSVLSQPYIANGNGVFQANGASTVQFNAPAYANRVPGVPVYSKNRDHRRNRGRNEAMAQSRMRLSPSSIQQPEHAPEGIRRRTASSAIRDATPFGGRTTRTRTSTSPKRFRFEKASRSAWMHRCSTPSTIPTSLCPARSKPVCRAVRSQPGSELSKARSRLLPAAWRRTRW